MVRAKPGWPAWSLAQGPSALDAVSLLAILMVFIGWSLYELLLDIFLELFQLITEVPGRNLAPKGRFTLIILIDQLQFVTEDPSLLRQ